MTETEKIQIADIAAKLTQLTMTKSSTHPSTENVVKTFSAYFDAITDKVSK